MLQNIESAAEVHVSKHWCSLPVLDIRILENRSKDAGYGSLMCVCLCSESQRQGSCKCCLRFSEVDMLSQSPKRIMANASCWVFCLFEAQLCYCFDSAVECFGNRSTGIDHSDWWWKCLCSFSPLKISVKKSRRDRKWRVYPNLGSRELALNIQAFRKVMRCQSFQVHLLLLVINKAYRRVG